MKAEWISQGEITEKKQACTLGQHPCQRPQSDEQGSLLGIPYGVLMEPGSTPLLLYRAMSPCSSQRGRKHTRSGEELGVWVHPKSSANIGVKTVQPGCTGACRRVSPMTDYTGQRDSADRTAAVTLGERSCLGRAFLCLQVEEMWQSEKVTRERENT